MPTDVQDRAVAPAGSVRAAGPARPLRPGPVLPAVVGGIVTVFTVLRLVVAGPGLDRVWAEDGFVFLWDAQRHGLESLGYVYAGYAHTLPRLWALVGAQVPLAQFALFAVLATAVTAGVLAAVTYDVARRVTGSASWAVLPALVLALAPAFRGSVGSLANLQWLLLAAAFWCVIDRTGNRWVPAVTALVAGLTTPLTVLLLPAALVAHRGAVVRARAVQAMVLGLAGQAALILFGARSAENPAVRHPELPDNLFSVAVTGVAGPNVPVVELGRLGTLDVSFLLGLAFAGLLLISLYEARRNRLAWAAVLTGVLLFAGTSVMSGAPTTRYAAAAAMLLVSGLALAGPQLPRVLGTATAAVLALNAVVGFAASDFRLSGPSWEADVARYQDSCTTTGEPTPIGLGPEGWGEIRLYCPR